MRNLHCVAFKKNISPYLSKTIALLDTDVHAAMKRKILRMLVFIETPKTYFGKLINQFFEILIFKHELITVKAFFMTMPA